MSGGSYNYLCHAAGDAHDLTGKSSELEPMAARLEGLGYHRAAADTRALVEVIRALETLSAPLANCWENIEWWDSCDRGEDDARKAAQAYEDACEPATKNALLAHLNGVIADAQERIAAAEAAQRGLTIRETSNA